MLNLALTRGSQKAAVSRLISVTHSSTKIRIVGKGWGNYRDPAGRGDVAASTVPGGAALFQLRLNAAHMYSGASIFFLGARDTSDGGDAGLSTAHWPAAVRCLHYYRYVYSIDKISFISVIRLILFIQYENDVFLVSVVFS
jgi:hypothetical protein